MRAFFIIVIILFSANSIIISQDDQHFCSKSKIQHYEKLLKVNQVQYPGDSNIDVTYYKLDVALNYSRRLIDGKITIKAKSLTSNLNLIFLDLQKKQLLLWENPLV